MNQTVYHHFTTLFIHVIETDSKLNIGESQHVLCQRKYVVCHSVHHLLIRYNALMIFSSTSILQI
jgi:hypothetical protein